MLVQSVLVKIKVLGRVSLLACMPGFVHCEAPASLSISLASSCDV